MVAASRQVAERRSAGARVRGSRGRLVAPAKRARCPSWVNMSIGAPPQPYPVLGCCLRRAAFRRAGLRAAASAVANSSVPVASAVAALSGAGLILRACC